MFMQDLLMELHLMELKRRSWKDFTDDEVRFLIREKAVLCLERTSVDDQTLKLSGSEWNCISSVWRMSPTGTLESLFYVKCTRCDWVHRFTGQSRASILQAHNDWHRERLLGVILSEGTVKTEEELIFQEKVTMEGLHSLHLYLEEKLRKVRLEADAVLAYIRKVDT